MSDAPGLGPNRFGEEVVGIEILEVSPECVRARVEIGAPGCLT